MMSQMHQMMSQQQQQQQVVETTPGLSQMIFRLLRLVNLTKNECSHQRYIYIWLHKISHMFQSYLATDISMTRPSNRILSIAQILLVL